MAQCVKSTTKSRPGGGPQGSSLGLWSFLSQTNDNPEDNSDENMFKFVDDKTTLEIINLLSIGMASHNIKASVPSNILTSNLVISNNNLKTQEHLHRISEWTKDKKMKLNVEKTKNIIKYITQVGVPQRGAHQERGEDPHGGHARDRRQNSLGELMLCFWRAILSPTTRRPDRKKDHHGRLPHRHGQRLWEEAHQHPRQG